MAARTSYAAVAGPTTSRGTADEMSCAVAAGTTRSTVTQETTASPVAAGLTTSTEAPGTTPARGSTSRSVEGETLAATRVSSRVECGPRGDVGTDLPPSTGSWNTGRRRP